LIRKAARADNPRIIEIRAGVRENRLRDPSRVFALFVEEAYEGRGIARALFECACNVLDEAGCPRMWLTTWPRTRAERFYRKAGWQVTGSDDGNLVFERHGRLPPPEQVS
jgi:GNAT superfamily N-acetyltransferase